MITIILRWVRHHMGRRALEARAGQHAKEVGAQLEDFYDVKSFPMEVHKNIEVEVKGKKVKKCVEVVEEGRKVKKMVMVEEGVKKVKKVITEKVSKDVVYVNNVCALLRHVLHQRGMNPATTLIRVGLDGGGGNFKIMVSLCPGNLSRPHIFF